MPPWHNACLGGGIYICPNMSGRLAILVIPFLLGTAAMAQDPSRLIAEGDSLLALERPQKALDKFTAAVDMAPSASTYSARARAWYRLDRMDRYLMDVEKALKLDSLHPEANFQRAMYASRSEDNVAVERYSSRALVHGAKEPLRYQLLILRGQARTETRDYAGAIEDLRSGLGDRTEDLPAMKSLARCYDAMGEHEASLHVLEKLCAVEPDDIGNWTNRGFELATLGRHEDALVVYGEALELDRDEPTALSDRAWSLLQLHREDEALRDVERSLKAYPANAFALRTRALLNLNKGLKEKACADLQLAHILGGVPDVDKLIDQNCAGVLPKR